MAPNRELTDEQVSHQAEQLAAYVVRGGAGFTPADRAAIVLALNDREDA